MFQTLKDTVSEKKESRRQQPVNSQRNLTIGVLKISDQTFIFAHPKTYNPLYVNFPSVPQSIAALILDESVADNTDSSLPVSSSAWRFNTYFITV